MRDWSRWNEFERGSKTRQIHKQKDNVMRVEKLMNNCGGKVKG